MRPVHHRDRFDDNTNYPRGCFDPCVVKSRSNPQLNIPPGCTELCTLGNAFEGQVRRANPCARVESGPRAAGSIANSPLAKTAAERC